MPAVVPPFPVANRPKVDFEIRELYRRLTTIERVLRTSAPSPAPSPVSINYVSAKVLYCSIGSVGFDQGWIGNRVKLRRKAALLLEQLHPISVVLSLTAYISELFARDGGPASPYGRLSFSDILPAEEPRPLYADYWGNIERDNMIGRYVTAPLTIDMKVLFPFTFNRYWYNVRRNHASGRMSSGRPVGTLPYLPLSVGFAFGDPTVAEEGQVANGEQWPEDAQGEVMVVAVWLDNLATRTFAGKPIRERSLFAVAPVKVGPR